MTDRKSVQRMVSALRHRGPDDEGVVVAQEAVLGHARLSIIDQAGGHQPMASVDQRFWITFNGEIYNYRELREELGKKGHVFGTHSDTEVVIESYRAWGEDCLVRFSGMFSFVLWDAERREIFAARDRFGKKPFYYSELPGGGLIFASELKALLAAGKLEPVLDIRTVSAFLLLGYIPRDSCIYSNVRTLPGGHCLRYRNGATGIRCYWSPQFIERHIRPEEAADELRRLLSEATRKRLVASDVPVGAFLSGGLDSSSVVILGQRQMSGPIKTFSVHISGYGDETGYAEEVARQEHTEHHHVELDVDAAELMGKMAEVYDEPFADPADIPTYLMAQFAAQFGKVVLTGDGGDELLGGYESSYLPLIRSESVPNRGLFYHLLRCGDDGLGWIFGKRAFKSPLHELRKAADEARIVPDIVARHLKRSRVPGDLSTAIRWPGIASEGSVVGSFESNGPEVNRVFLYDLLFTLQADMMVKTDRATMAHGLEARCPFLDSDLVNFALSLPLHLKIRGTSGKCVLRDAMADLWPASLHKRDKRGFGVPLDLWLNQPRVKKRLQHLLACSSRMWDLLDRHMVSDMTNAFYRSRSVSALSVWTLAAFLFWFERWESSFSLPAYEP